MSEELPSMLKVGTKVIIVLDDIPILVVRTVMSDDIKTCLRRHASGLVYNFIYFILD